MNNKDIVLLHGWGGSKESLSLLGKELSEFGFITHQLEMPGHGGTPEMSMPWDMEMFARWAMDEMAKLKLHDPILIGHSFGGRIILEMATSSLFSPQKIVLIDASGIKPKNNLKRTFWKGASKFAKIFKDLPFYDNMRRKVYKNVVREKDYVNTSNNLRETFKLVNEQYYDEVIKNITSKTLIIWGEEDKTTPLWMAEVMHEKINGSELKTLPGTHGLPLKKPSDVAYLINNFINE